MTLDEKNETLQGRATSIRKCIIRMLSESASGHPGGSLSMVEILTVLYFEIMKHDPKDPEAEQRDLFHLSKGHGCPAWYATLIECGYIEAEHEKKLRRLGGLLQGHPDPKIPGVDCSSGSLGQGLSVAVGMALAERLDKKDTDIYCIMGDGEIQEGNIWEAAMAASQYKLGNLCAVVDCNGLQIDGKVKDIMNVYPVDKKFEAFGWHVIKCNGHDIVDLIEAFNKAKEIKDKPVVLVAETVKGKGISFMEHNLGFHGVTPNVEETEKALKELGEQ